MGTKYSESMKLYYTDENDENKPYYMGCYGIGLGRIIACLIENNIIRKDEKIKGFSLPYDIAPYKVHIIYSEDNTKEAENLYDEFSKNNIKAIIDDRKNLTIGNRINDVYVFGTPKMIVLGKKFDKQNYEIENTNDSSKEVIKKEEIIKYFKNL